MKNKSWLTLVLFAGIMPAAQARVDAGKGQLEKETPGIQGELKQIAIRENRDKQRRSSIRAIVGSDVEKARKKKAKKTAKRKKNKIARSKSHRKPVRLIAPANKPGSYPELNEKDIAMGADFRSNRGKLPWPVDNSVVSIPFGVYTIEGTSIRGDNPGVTIATPVAGAPVKAVFDGEVSGIDRKGDAGIVFIRHGKYLTVYSNLSEINVMKGTVIKKGQVIGLAGEANEGSGGQLDFLLMIENNIENPERWLHR